MKEFFSLKITNKKLIPALLISLLLLATSCCILVQQQKKTASSINTAPAKATDPQKQQTIMVYTSRDPFKPLVETKKKELPPIPEKKFSSLPQVSSSDLTSTSKTVAENQRPPNSINLQGIIISNNQSSALLYVGNRVQTNSISR